jgi:PAS domain S-box-containing protein
MNLPEPTRRRATWGLLLIFAILSLGIGVGGAFYYRRYERHFRAEAESQLSAIAELKADELAQYRKERLGDANSFFQNATFSGLVRRFFDRPEDTEAQEQLRGWLNKYQTYYQYDRVFLLDDQGVERMASSAAVSPVSAVLLRQIAEVLRSRKITFHDFHFHEHSQQVYLTLLVPILDGPDYSRPLGVLALRINPETYLYPFIKRWPTPSRTAETLLVRRDGTNVLFLNELKFRTNSALNLRVSLENTNQMAVKAVLGQEGIVEGADYRGKPVLAALRAIPDSPWYLVAKMDTAEVYAPLRERLKLTILLASLLLISAGLGVGALWRHQRVWFYKERYQIAESLRESEERFRRVFEEGPTGMAMVDETFHFIRVNPAFAAMLGYSEAELQKMTFLGITHPDHVQQDVEQVRRLLRGELAVYHTEKRYIARSGKEMWGQMQVVVVRNAGGAFRYFLAIIGNITERKQAEQELLNSRALYYSLVENLPQNIFRKDRAGRFQFVNDRFCRDLRRSLEDIVGRTDADFFPPELAEAYRKDDLRIMDTGQVLDQEEKHVGADGRELFVHVVKTPLRDAQGRVIGIQGVFWDITGRKRAEELLRLNQERLIKVVTQTRCILSSGQVEGPEGWRERALLPESPFRWNFSVQNEEAAQKILPLELAPGERYHQAWFRSRDRADHAQMNWSSGNAFLNDLPFYRNEFRCLDRHGIGHWMQQLVTVRKLAENRWEIFGITTDISDLKRVEAEMRESQALYHSLVNQMPAGIFRKDAKGRYVFVNSEFCRLEGLTPDQLLGKTVLELGLKDAALAAKRAGDHATIMQSGNPIEADEIHAGADGEKRNYHTIKSPVLDSAGKILGTQGILFDVTERQRAEQALRDSEVRYRQLFELESDAIVLVDRETHRYVDVNQAAQQLYGYSREEFLQMTPEDVSAEPEKTRNHIDSADVHVPLRWHRKKNGKRFAVEINANQIIHRGRPTALVALRDITERRRVEEALKESEARYQRISEAITDYIFTVRVADGRAVETTHGPGCLAVTGYQMKEFANDPFLWFRMVAAEDRSRVEDQARRILAGEDPPPIEHRIVRKNGTVRWVRNTFVSHRDERGVLVAYDGLLQDITERKQAEEALRESEERLRITLETTKIGSWDWDVKKDVWYASPTYYTMLGYEPDPDHVDWEKWLQRVHPDDRAANVARIQAVLAGSSSSYQYEHRIKHADGSYHWHSVIGHVVASDENGQPVRLIGVRMDITERKLAEETLGRSEATLHSLFLAAPVGISVLKNRVIQSMNAFWCDNFGYPMESVVGQSSRMFYSSDEEYDRVGQALYGQLQEYGVASVETKIRRHDGVLRDVILTAAPLRAGDPEAGNVVVVHDVSERKQAEEALRESEARFRRLSEATFEAVAIHKSGVLLNANDQYFEMFGYTPDELLGKQVLPLTVAPETLAYLMKQVENSGLGPYEVIGVRKNGTRFPMEIRVREGEHEGQRIRVGAIRDITERKQAEDALRDSENKFRNLFNNAEVGMFRTRLDGLELLDANDKYLSMLGRTREEVVGKPSAILWADPKEREEMIKILKAKGHVNDFECRLFNKAGQVINCLTSLRLYPETGILEGSIIDITGRKLAEATIARERQLLRTLIDLLPETFYIKDLDGRFLVVNEALAKQWGKENPSQMLGLSDADLFPAEQAAKFRAEELKVFAGEPVINRESICVYYDGRDHAVVTSKVPFRDSQGRICGLVGIGHDITERKRADEALRASEAELRAILESTGDGILAVDRTGEKVIKTNRRYAELWRIPQSLIDAGDNNALRNFVLNQLADPDAFLKRVHELYGTDTVAVDTLVFKDGRILERHGFPMQLDGAVIGRVWSFRDITERKRQERELIEKSSELERFTYTVSHDLKSPLVTVKTFLGYLEQDLAGSDQERVKQDVAYMHTAADKMGKLLDELLNLARVGRKMNPAERVTFKELAQEAVRLVAGRISTGGAEVQVADAAVVLEGDRARLTEIWQNLVENACKFMGNQPKPRVEIGVERRGSEMVFFVHDNGAGIEPRYQARVFGLFEKLDPKGEGTGMGLALVKRIVEIYKGRIWVESAGPGQGANFLFTLPEAVIINPEQSS